MLHRNYHFIFHIPTCRFAFLSVIPIECSMNVKNAFTINHITVLIFFCHPFNTICCNHAIIISIIFIIIFINNHILILFTLYHSVSSTHLVLWLGRSRVSHFLLKTVFLLFVWYNERDYTRVTTNDNMSRVTTNVVNLFQLIFLFSE